MHIAGVMPKASLMPLRPTWMLVTCDETSPDAQAVSPETKLCSFTHRRERRLASSTWTRSQRAGGYPRSLPSHLRVRHRAANYRPHQGINDNSTVLALPCPSPVQLRRACPFHPPQPPRRPWPTPPGGRPRTTSGCGPASPLAAGWATCRTSSRLDSSSTRVRPVVSHTAGMPPH